MGLLPLLISRRTAQEHSQETGQLEHSRFWDLMVPLQLRATLMPLAKVGRISHPRLFYSPPIKVTLLLGVLPQFLSFLKVFNLEMPTRSLLELAGRPQEA